MSDKVFFLRFKDHCATLNMFVTLALTVAIWVQKNFISSAEGGKKAAVPIYLGSVPFKANK